VAIGRTNYWATPPEVVRTYTLTYTSEAQPEPQPLCTTSVNEALLFAGDRYDAERKTVTATGGATAGWFNIACAGTALAKLHLTRHTEASQTVPTTAAERQAMLKMFTADVCGDGTSFTVQGQPLLWADAKGLTAFASAPASLEAVWSDRGALCLDTPRRPELEAAIAAHCPRPPRCSELSPAALAKGHVTSANAR
jgi:ADYC domain